MNVYEGLNTEQSAAVRHDKGPLLVVAGAGTGKTKVITRRIARLVTDNMAKPGQILALTFTDKAAREMGDRLGEMIGWEALQVPVLTFHAFGTELLRNYSTHINRLTVSDARSRACSSTCLLSYPCSLHNEASLSCRSCSAIFSPANLAL